MELSRIKVHSDDGRILKLFATYNKERIQVAINREFSTGYWIYSIHPNQLKINSLSKKEIADIIELAKEKK